MTPQDALVELLARVGASGGDVVFTGAQELASWPAAAVTTMKVQKLLVKVRPAASVVCPGCERECVMLVHVIPAQGTASRAFVVCDKRSDINRVNIPLTTSNSGRRRAKQRPISSPARWTCADRVAARPVRDVGKLGCSGVPGTPRTWFCLWTGR